MPPTPDMPQAVQDELTNWCYLIGADPPSLDAITITDDPPAAPVTTIYWRDNPVGEPLQPMAPPPPDSVMPYFLPVT